MKVVLAGSLVCYAIAALELALALGPPLVAWIHDRIGNLR